MFLHFILPLLNKSDECNQQQEHRTIETAAVLLRPSGYEYKVETSVSDEKNDACSRKCFQAGYTCRKNQPIVA
jgi:hypothetical protein